MDSETTVEELKERLAEFVQERDWEQFHNPKDVALHLTVEAAELLDHFRYRETDELPGIIEEKREEIEGEVADVIFLVLEFARMNNIDVTKALDAVLLKNRKRYPIEKSKGKKLKYTELK